MIPLLYNVSCVNWKRWKQECLPVRGRLPVRSQQRTGHYPWYISGGGELLWGLFCTGGASWDRDPPVNRWTHTTEKSTFPYPYSKCTKIVCWYSRQSRKPNAFIFYAEGISREEWIAHLQNAADGLSFCLKTTDVLNVFITPPTADTQQQNGRTRGSKCVIHT